MSEKRYLSILAACCLLLAALCALALAGRHSRAPERVETALLNSRYSPQLHRIAVAAGGRELSLLQGTLGGRFLWWGTAQAGLGTAADGSKELVFPVDSITMQEFLSAMERVRSLSVVSRSQDRLSSFGLADGEGVVMDFILSDGSTASRIIFGDRNYSGQRVYLKTPDSPVYQGRDEFYPWLTAAPKSWADMALVCQQLLGISGEREVQRIVVSMAASGDGFTQKILTRGASDPAQPQDFSSKAGRLLSLRGGSLVHPDMAEGRPLLAEIVLDTGLGASATLRVYQGNQSQSDGEVSSYYVVPRYDFMFGGDSGHPEGGGALDSGFGTSRLSYGFEISGWTWDNLRALVD